jgi:hypothetical protein
MPVIFLRSGEFLYALASYLTVSETVSRPGSPCV